MMAERFELKPAKDGIPAWEMYDGETNVGFITNFPDEGFVATVEYEGQKTKVTGPTLSTTTAKARDAYEKLVMPEDWQTKHLGLTDFLESVETDPAQLSNFLKALSFPVGHVLGQTDFVTWDEMKRAAFDEKALVQIAKQAREWRGDRTPSTPMYLAYEIVAISLESAAANDPIAVECEELTDGIITKAIQDFPIPNSKTGEVE
jgi:hypothetical protein